MFLYEEATITGLQQQSEEPENVTAVPFQPSQDCVHLYLVQVTIKCKLTSLDCMAVTDQASGLQNGY